MKTPTCYRRVDAHIPSATLGWNLSAWCYLPSDGSNASPVIIMGHGLSCTKAMQLEPFAKVFAAAGYACIVFDYRRWGNSDGTPRHCVSSKEQVEDYTSVVTYCKTSHEFNRRPIVLWGFSAAGAHCLTLAAEVTFPMSWARIF
ncbi:hypothetical protein SERLA73DRAFT_182386 [Serpula lacrymans var. lacrymans S7.3]|uniref:Serine aminopeptidase S33 domain-containing protein n=2 Tax=Serpula lacrymans var. lacrymans TaxID=341189 RepID=F8PX35_SERL3|nr:uncharacterized protein SERLADRAFT_469007 [Serpula lacrymans var. lacrymans S7.9]EGN99414.1 hypothetical protein SERLA73DRAFT_182386 [Serpula lacrymans var. lacrymans S7.3]EGO24977.1 hypothetical protein SERLADRAFT_469007 [Serpula lacrymans var. lacrymans S7.9]